MVEKRMRYRKGAVHATTWSHAWEQVDGSCCRHGGCYRGKGGRACKRAAVLWFRGLVDLIDAVTLAIATIVVVVLVLGGKLILLRKARGNAAGDCIARRWLGCGKRSATCRIGPISNWTATSIFESCWTSKWKSEALL